jgi:hypothetical protein
MVHRLDTVFRLVTFHNEKHPPKKNLIDQIGVDQCTVALPCSVIPAGTGKKIAKKTQYLCINQGVFDQMSLLGHQLKARLIHSLKP